MSWSSHDARTIRLRPLPLAAALVFTAGLGHAAAQTVVVRSAPAASTIELTMNGGAPVTATADADGDATLAVPPRPDPTDVLMRVDTCGNRVKVLIADNGRQFPDAEPGCNRTELWGVYVMRPITTFVIDVDSPTTTVHMRQGPAPPEWIRRGPPEMYAYPWGTPSTGFALSAGVGLSTFSRATETACGDVVCNSDTTGGAVTVSAEYWFKPWIAAQVGYARPGDTTATYTSGTYNFNTRTQARLFLIGAKAGFVKGPARMYGLGGLNRHEATTRTSQTINDVTVTVDNVSRTFPANTQTFEQKTAGWSWTAGGGFELWVARFAAIYGEFYRAKIKGDTVGGSGVAADDAANFLVVGVRLRIGPSGR